MEEKTNSCEVDAAANEGWKQHKVETVNPDKVSAMVNLNNLVPKHAIHCCIYVPNVLLRLSGFVVDLLSIDIGNVVQHRPQDLLTVDLIKLEMRLLINKQWITVKLCQRKSDRLFFFDWYPAGVSNRTDARHLHAGLHRQQGLVVPSRCPFTLRRSA